MYGRLDHRHKGRRGDTGGIPQGGVQHLGGVRAPGAQNWREGKALTGRCELRWLRSKMSLGKPASQWELYPMFFREPCRSAQCFATGSMPPSTNSITTRIRSEER